MVKAKAFCPAHITGFFKVEKNSESQAMGSLGAGFSIMEGVTTLVQARPAVKPGYDIRVTGYGTDDTRLSEHVISEFFKLANGSFYVSVLHDIAVPVGYGLGSSSAAALSLSIALNDALGLELDSIAAARIAHEAEICCRTGLGDVIAAYHGGFEIRTRAGPPGTGSLEKISLDSSVIMICWSPISTRQFIAKRLDSINGLGERMVGRLLKSRDIGDFQDMSLEFSRHVSIMTPRMEAAAYDLERAGIRCGVALFGETVFALVSSKKEAAVRSILAGRGGIVIKTKIDNAGARLISC